MHRVGDEILISLDGAALEPVFPLACRIFIDVGRGTVATLVQRFQPRNEVG
jgi:hypothetical protein